MKFAMSYSCGKDSTLALYRLKSAGHEPVALIVTVSGDEGRSWSHGVGRGLLRDVSASLGISLIEAVCGADDYEDAFELALSKAKDLGAEACAFGDIDIADHRSWNEARCQAAGMEALMPLWQGNRLDITREFIDTGFLACIKAVSIQHGLGQEYLGRTLTMDVVREIEALGLDPCGENGEYHTFCYNGPMFSAPVKTVSRGMHSSEYSHSLILEPEGVE